jgi:hypothetical protein
MFIRSIHTNISSVAARLHIEPILIKHVRPIAHLPLQRTVRGQPVVLPTPSQRTTLMSFASLYNRSDPRRSFSRSNSSGRRQHEQQTPPDDDGPTGRSHGDSSGQSAWRVFLYSANTFIIVGTVLVAVDAIWLMTRPVPLWAQPLSGREYRGYTGTKSLAEIIV